MSAAGVLAAYVVLAVYAALMLIFMSWYDLRKDPEDSLSLLNIFQGAALALIPILNILVCIGLTIWFITEVAPKIILFGKKE